MDANLASLTSSDLAIQVSTDSDRVLSSSPDKRSEDGQEWSYRGSGMIYRYKQGEKNSESLRIEFPRVAGQPNCCASK